MPRRAKRNKIYSFFWKLSYDPWFFLTSMILVGINTILLAIDRYPIDKTTSNFISSSNDVLNFVFIIELIIKVAGLGTKEFLRD